MLGNDKSILTTVEGHMKVQSAEDWITEEDTPDPVIKRVMNEYVVIRPFSATPKTKGGLLIPDVVKNNTNQLVTIGKVVGVGEMAGKRTGVSPVEVGQYVIYPKHGGALLRVNGVKVVILPDDAIFMEIDRDTILGSASDN